MCGFFINYFLIKKNIVQKIEIHYIDKEVKIYNIMSKIKFVNFVNEKFNNIKEIYIENREDLDELLADYPNGAPRVIIGENVDLSFLFQDVDCGIDISNWDVSNVYDMSWMFAFSNFNGDISNWDVSKVVNMNYMFFNSKFNRNISNWDVSKVEDINHMFNKSSFNQNVSRWEVNNVVNMEDTFKDTPLEKSGKLPYWYKNR